jgi:hypothetical protein
VTKKLLKRDPLHKIYTKYLMRGFAGKHPGNKLLSATATKGSDRFTPSLYPRSDFQKEPAKKKFTGRLRFCQSPKPYIRHIRTDAAAAIHHLPGFPLRPLRQIVPIAGGRYSLSNLLDSTQSARFTQFDIPPHSPYKSLQTNNLNTDYAPSTRFGRSKNMKAPPPTGVLGSIFPIQASPIV